MLEAKGDIFKLMQNADGICVTTNGVVKQSGELVMGAGIALSFKQRWPDLPAEFGKWVKLMGNVPCVVAKPINVSAAGVFNSDSRTIFILSYPTKHDYREDSDLNLIYHGAHKLVEWTNRLKMNKVLLTRPGCGLGKRSWEHEVRPLISPILDDRFTVLG